MKTFSFCGLAHVQISYPFIQLKFLVYVQSYQTYIYTHLAMQSRSVGLAQAHPNEVSGTTQKGVKKTPAKMLPSTLSKHCMYKDVP